MIDPAAPYSAYGVNLKTCPQISYTRGLALATTPHL
jgi:hypothetical protein